MFKNNMSLQEYKTFLNQTTNNKPNLHYLFNTELFASISRFKQTSEHKALREYEQYSCSPDFVPHNFYSILEKELKKHSIEEVTTKYKKCFLNIAKYTETTYEELIELITIIKYKNNNMVNKLNVTKAYEKLKNTIRKFNSVYKMEFIKEKMSIYIENLKKISLKKEKQTNEFRKLTEKPIDVSLFINYLFAIQEIKDATYSIYKIIYEKEPTEEELKNFLHSMCDVSQEKAIEKTIELSKPDCIELYLKDKASTRLKNNYLDKFLDTIKKYPRKVQNYIVEYLNSNTLSPKTLSNELYLSDKELFVTIKQLLKDANGSISLTNDTIVINLPFKITEEQRKECKKYILKLKQLKKYKFIQRSFFDMYRNQSQHMAKINSDKKDTEKQFDDINYSINYEKMLNRDNIILLFNEIDEKTFEALTINQMASLKRLLIDEELLISYYNGNINFTILINILKHFGSIYAHLGEDKITLSNLNEIIMISKLFEYADDFTIGLVGLDVIKKVINYNQFAGTKVTDEVIKSRIKKVIDLAKRAEKTKFSSLPYDSDVTYQSYKLERYKNNDPNVFTSGIETKTCFFVSVNENDFFFYTLLNKNGEVLRVVDKDGNFIARASCFRKNRVLMINGIRLKNNKIHPENKNDEEEFIKIVTLFKEMARKLIEITADAECPIDFVVCNKAGILENNIFEDEYEIVGQEFLMDPLNRFDEDWKEFVSMYEGEENLLQEVYSGCTTGFTTDFGGHYPAILLYSRNNRTINKFRDIGYEDPAPIYKRPRTTPKILVPAEIDKEILDKVNRIKALSCFEGDQLEQEIQRKNYRLLTDTSNISSLAIGEDWYYIEDFNGNAEIIFANINEDNLNEIKQYTRIQKLYESKNYSLKKTHK